METGDLAGAAGEYERLAVDNVRSMLSYGHSAAQLFAEAALLRFRMGEADEGVRLTKEALRFFGQFPEANGFMIDALAEWVRLQKSRQGE
jgi:hypothetical protein